MGTRNLTIVKLNGEIKIRQYCQWDGYPTGVGTRIATYLQNELDLKKLKSNLKKVKFITSEEAEKKHLIIEKEILKNPDQIVRKQLGVEQNNTLEQKMKAALPQFHRDTGPDIIKLVQDGTVTELLDNGEFNQDSWCEYAYEIDLDEKTVTVLYGFHPNDRKTYTFKQYTPQAMKKLEKDLSTR